MKVNLEKMIYNILYPDELEDMNYFKQFNLYKTIEYRNYMNKIFCNDEVIKICKVETTAPTLKIISTKIINTIEGTSLEGQHLSGKKLIIIGEIGLKVILTYSVNCGRCKNAVTDVKIPFSTFIIIPKDNYCDDEINLRYLIEDSSTAYIGKGKALVSITILMQYLDTH